MGVGEAAGVAASADVDVEEAVGAVASEARTADADAASEGVVDADVEEAAGVEEAADVGADAAEEAFVRLARGVKRPVDWQIPGTPSPDCP